MENWIEETINRFQELLTHEEALEWAESLVWTLEQNSFYVMEGDNYLSHFLDGYHTKVSEPDIDSVFDYDEARKYMNRRRVVGK